MSASSHKGREERLLALKKGDARSPEREEVIAACTKKKKGKPRKASPREREEKGQPIVIFHERGGGETSLANARKKKKNLILEEKGRGRKVLYIRGETGKHFRPRLSTRQRKGGVLLQGRGKRKKGGRKAGWPTRKPDAFVAGGGGENILLLLSVEKFGGATHLLKKKRRGTHKASARGGRKDEGTYLGRKFYPLIGNRPKKESRGRVLVAKKKEVRRGAEGVSVEPLTSRGGEKGGGRA